MESLSSLEIVFAALVVTVAFAARGTAGFGGQAVAVPLLALVLPLTAVLSAVVALALLASVGHLLRERRSIDWREIRVLLPYSVVGVIAGLLLLQHLDMRVLTKAFGIFVILYACFALATATRPLRIPPRALYPAGAVLSTLAGATGATFGAAAGPIYVIYFNARRLERDAFRATLTMVLTVQAVLRMCGYVQLGFYDYATLVLVVAGVPLMLLGSVIGTWLAGRLNQRWFNLGIAGLLLVSGTALLFK